jgi:hypothetical protein
MPAPPDSPETLAHPANPAAQANPDQRDRPAHLDSPETMANPDSLANQDNPEELGRREFAPNIAQSMEASSSRMAPDGVKQHHFRGKRHIHPLFIFKFSFSFSPSSFVILFLHSLFSFSSYVFAASIKTDKTAILHLSTTIQKLLLNKLIELSFLPIIT